MSSHPEPPADDDFVGTQGVGQHYDNIHPRTVVRRVKKKKIPPPDMTVNGRHLWRWGTIRAHDRKLIREGMAAHGQREPPAA
jgi:hypothetical protein